MRNYLLILFAFAPASLYAQMFGGQLKSTKAGSITALNCASATNNGTLTQGTSASGVSSSVPYTGGNGGAHNGQTVTSTGVTGLTATLSAGTFANGAGSLTYNITGTPGASGTASFLLNIGGQSCIINIIVALNNATASCGATNVHNPNLSYGSMTDQDGNTYKTIVIGTQEWMAENLKTSHYRNGAAIDLVTNISIWGNLTSGATCWYMNDSASYNCPYGKLYNWFAVSDPRNLCPMGWHVPTDAEWVTLTDYLGGLSVAGGKMKSTGTQYWSSPNVSANNISGFSGIQSGRVSTAIGDFANLFLWSTTASNGNFANCIYLQHFLGSVDIGPYQKQDGLSVRCLKDVSSPQGSINTIDCGSSNNNGTLTSGTAASAVSFIVPYTGGNGSAHNGQTVTSTGVIGLTATLAAGSFANGAGSLTYTITGTPSASGTASFALSIGGQSCTLSINVLTASSPAYPPNSVFCASGPTSVVDVTNPATGRIWMDRNLGATQAATSSTDANSYGDLYQWGRRSDGHQCRTSATTTTLSSTDQPANGSFIVASNPPYDWRSPQNNNLWQGINGVNNPCPSGYRLPTEAELETERLSWSSNNAQGAFASLLKLPVAGSRSFDNGSLYFVGTYGYYWSSTVNGVNSQFLRFYSSYASMNSVSRAYGFSVRCLKD